MTFQEFNRRINELRQIIGDAMTFFSAWEELMVGDEDSAQALNRYRGLFLPARAALLRMAIIHVAKVFDRHPRAISMRNLLNAAKEAPGILVPSASPGDLVQVEQRMHQNEELLHRVRAFRDQRIAHHDAEITPGMGVHYGETKALMEAVIEMYNILRTGHDRQFTSFDGMAQDAKNHTAAVVHLIREDRDRGLQRIREATRKMEDELGRSDHVDPRG